MRYQTKANREMSDWCTRLRKENNQLREENKALKEELAKLKKDAA